MPLTDLAIKSAKPTTRIKKLSVGGGLHIEMSPVGTKTFKFSYRFGGKQKTLTGGRYPDMRLAQARAWREELKSLIREGIDPALAFYSLRVPSLNWRPLDFGWPDYEGSQTTTSNPPDRILGPNLVYEFGDGPKQGQGVIAGQLFRSSIDPAFGDTFVFFNINGTVFSIASEKLTDGPRHDAGEFEDKTQDFQPDQGEIGTLVGYGAGVASTAFYLLDSDGELFEVTQEAR